MRGQHHDDDQEDVSFSSEDLEEDDEEDVPQPEDYGLNVPQSVKTRFETVGIRRAPLVMSPRK